MFYIIIRACIQFCYVQFDCLVYGILLHITYILYHTTLLYFLGGIGLIWSILWFVIIFETPAAHPRISIEERKEIEDAIGTSTSKKKPTYVPWSSILSSPCVWAIIITHATSVYGYFTIVNQLPTYMKYILHFDIKSVRFLKYFCDLWETHREFEEFLCWRQPFQRTKMFFFFSFLLLFRMDCYHHYHI